MVGGESSDLGFPVTSKYIIDSSPVNWGISTLAKWFESALE
jgi:hypothetical protein